METLTRIQDTVVVVDEEEGYTQIADLVIENRAGRWYGVDLGAGDWDYLTDNGDYIPAPA